MTPRRGGSSKPRGILSRTDASKAAIRMHLQRRVGGCDPSAVARHVKVVFELFGANPGAGREEDVYLIVVCGGCGGV